MPQPYVGEIRMFAGNFAPTGWMICEGQLLSISENPQLFGLIGTTYGGDGQSTFALPDLRGRIPVHQGNGFVLAETGGAEEVVLTVSQIPAHSHPLHASLSNATSSNPQGNLTAVPSDVGIYQSLPSVVNMSSQAISPIGGSQPHANFQPYLCINFIISLSGLFPSRP